MGLQKVFFSDDMNCLSIDPSCGCAVLVRNLNGFLNQMNNRRFLKEGRLFWNYA
jgi:hypothetical protein